MEKTIIRLPEYVMLDTEPRTPRQMVARLKSAHEANDERRTGIRCRAYGLTEEAESYLDNKEQQI